MHTIVLSVGGSIIAPDKPDHFFLAELKNFVIKNISSHRFVIVCGGGKTNRYYNDAASRVSNVAPENLDWLGIMATRLNAELVRVIFGDLAHSKVIIDPTKALKSAKPIIVAAGWKPGWSTDYVAVLLAKRLGAETVLNLTNMDYVYTKDPNIDSTAKRIYDITWKEYRKLISSKWSPRLSTPFDPIASKEAQKSRLRVVSLRGTNFSNLSRCLAGSSFDGTVIHP
ncbi:MAG: UMP kinase [Nanoarchaeota archaeon]|nr:UMP kinase [Nanoarchaeota archaeon]